jgi:uncharacterized protein YdaU (DUF1376 family)
MSLPYYKRFPRDFLDGTIGLCLETKGAYAIVLDLIYMRGGRLPDDPKYIAGQLGCSVRKWNSLRAELVSLGKLNVENGLISNFRADVLLEETRTFRDKQAENRSYPNKNSGLQSPKSDHLKPDTEEEVRETTANAVVAHTSPEQPNPQKGKGKVRGVARGSRLSESWNPTLKDYAFAAKHNLTREEINREADRFRNHWTAATGKGSVKLDWEAAWRNWLIGDYGIVTKRASASNASRNGSRTEAFDRLAERLQGGSDRSDAWQHDEPATEGGYVIDVSPTRITG